VELNEHPITLVKQGKWADVPLLHGSNLDEGAMFDPADSEMDSYTIEELKADVNRGFSAVMGNSSGDVIAADYMPQVHPSYYSAAWWASQRSLGDAAFGCPSSWTSDLLASRGSPVYHYYFTHPTFDVFAPTTHPLCLHSSEISFVFHMVGGATAEEAALSNAMATYWAHFVITGSPNGNETSRDVGAPVWPEYGKEGHVLQLDVASAGGVRVISRTPPGCHFFNEWSNRVIGAAPSSLPYRK